MNIARKYKLTKLTGINQFSDKENTIINFVNSKIENLTEFRITENPHKIYYMNKEGKFICRYNSESGYLLVRYEPDYQKFIRDNHIEYDELEDFIKCIMEVTYKIPTGFCGISSTAISYKVESEYKSRQQ